MFEVDRDAMTARCMAGHLVSLSSPKRLRTYLQANFPIKDCIRCPFWDACGGEPLRRIRRVLFPISGSIATLLWDMATENSRVLDLLRQRSGMVEPHFHQFKGIGMERARFVGRRKVELDWTLTAAGLNLRRMARLLKAAA